MALTKGRLLVATPLLGDPNFERSVVLMIEHDAEGAMGVVLNRPSVQPVEANLPEWARFAPSPDVFFIGGPVGVDSVLALAARVDGPGAAAMPDGRWWPVVDGVGVLDLGVDDVEVGPALAGVRLFAGYAGWGERQLEAEIAEGAWWVVDAEHADAMCAQPDDLWSAVLRRQPLPLRMWAHHPKDRNSN